MEKPDLKHQRLRDKLPAPSPGMDISLPAILKAGAALLGIAVIVHILMWWMFDVMDKQSKKRDPELSPVVSREKQQPPHPRLQVTPEKDLREVQAEEKFLRETYGWVDEKNGIVRIPVEEAMKLYVQRQGAKP